MSWGTMAHRRSVEIEQEPVGIVISGGSRAEPTPRFTAYVWGPVPTPEIEESGALAEV